MIIDTLRRLSLLVLLCLLQALVLNRIKIDHCATPLLYVYFAIIFPRKYPRWASLLWAFLMGLSIDTFSNTPGLASASMTLVAVLQPYLLEFFLPRDAEENIKVSSNAIGRGNFAALASIIVVIYCVVFFTLESFSFFNWIDWLESIGGSIVLTLLLVFTFESVRK
ncbi:MAG: rod shape-determining protein MreD [Prevotella sp.]|nr:rod shape-determining protein MreD [Prevotella sp.]